jgi:hypothetical protein
MESLPAEACLSGSSCPSKKEGSESLKPLNTNWPLCNSQLPWNGSHKKVLIAQRCTLLACATKFIFILEQGFV